MSNTSLAIDIMCVVVAGIGAQWAAWRFGLPAIVLLFAVGLTVGPGLKILDPQRAFGPALRPLVGLAVAIVVFEGGLALNVRELRAAAQGVLRVTAIALPLSLMLGALAAHAVAGFPWGPALLFGAITVVTGPTVILPLLRHTRLERRTASILKWEAIVNDPVGALLAALILSVLLAEHRPQTGASVALGLLAGLLVAIALGAGAAMLTRWLFLRDLVPEVLKTPMLLALVLWMYSIANLVMDEAGLAAATVFGVVLANLRIPGLPELARFKEALVVMLVSALFVILTASLDRSVITHLSWSLAALTAAMMFLVRPMSIALATLGTDLGWRDRLLVGWIAPRGIVAASVAGLASTQLSAAAYPRAEELMPAVFALIAATIVAHGFSLRPLARVLRLDLGENAVLGILGATAWSIALAEVLAKEGIGVLLIDTYPGALEPAQRRGLPVLQAELLSEHGAEALAEVRMDYLLAATPNDLYNSLINVRLAPELGRHRVAQFSPPGNDLNEWAGVSREWRGQVIGAGEMDVAQINGHWRRGWRFRILTGQTEQNEALMSCGLRIMTLKPGGAITFQSSEAPLPTPGGEDRLVVFVPPEALR